MKILSIIPARGGSKGVLNKNILNLNNKPLIYWSIKASQESKYIKETIVSSDSDKILTLSKKYGVNTVKRPDYLATDLSKTEPVITHVLKSNICYESYDYLVLLQPTSPLRNCLDIDKSIDLMLNKNATSLISVKKIDNKVLKSFKINEFGFMDGICNNEYPFMPRQSLPSVFMPNGAIYIVRVDEFLKTEKLFSDRCIMYEMSKEKSIDIDTKEDFAYIQNFFKAL